MLVWSFWSSANLDLKGWHQWSLEVDQVRPGDLKELTCYAIRFRVFLWNWTPSLSKTSTSEHQEVSQNRRVRSLPVLLLMAEIPNNHRLDVFENPQKIMGETTVPSTGDHRMSEPSTVRLRYFSGPANGWNFSSAFHVVWWEARPLVVQVSEVPQGHLTNGCLESVVLLVGGW